MLGYIFNLKLKILLYFFITIYIFWNIAEVVIFVGRSKISAPILVWWTPFMIGNDKIINCFKGAYECIITKNRTHKHYANLGAYLFYGSHIKNHEFPLPRNSNIPWAIFHEESPKNYAPLLYQETQSLFNITSTFSRHSDFPVTLQYLRDLNLIKDLKYYVPVDVKNKFLNELSPVLYIQSSCDTPMSRDYFVKELGKFVKIDSYGKCLTNKAFPKELSEIPPLDFYNEKLLQFVSQYKFTIAFENSVCADYITEKLWRPLIVGSIPIYLGSPTIEDWLPNNNSAIIVKNYKSIEAVGNLIKEINANDTFYESFLEHKTQSKILNDPLMESALQDHPIPSFECFVCKTVHRNNYGYKRKNVNMYKCPKPNIPDKENTWNQHWRIGKCQSKALKLLIDKNEPYSSELFEQTWKRLLYDKNC